MSISQAIPVKNGELRDAVRTQSYSPASIFVAVQQFMLATGNGDALFASTQFLEIS